MIIFKKYLSIVLLIGFWCCEDSKNNDCIDESKISYDYQCIIENGEYQPVCGCNGVFYEDVCFAENAGVSEWIDGECD